jgi:eukaryotic-like serine/threonine-protein kinase
MAVTSTTSWRELDRRISAYESALQKGEARVEDFLPAESDPAYASTLRELILVRAEFESARGQSPTMLSLQSHFPQLESDQLLRSSLELDISRLMRSDPSAGASAELSPISFTAGTRVGPFRIIRPIARGAFASVYLAAQPALAERHVVLKMSRHSLGESDKLARVQHTNIVPLFSAHRIESLHVLCMPYLGEQTLAQLDRSTTSPQQMKSIALGLAEGLSHAHGRGLLHLDIKPANVLITDEGVPMLLDFNLSMRTDRPLQGAGGTVAYMSPEQLKRLLDTTGESSAPLTPASDVYSLGLLLHELLVGSPAFALPPRVEDASVCELLAARSKSPPMLPRLPGLSRSMQSILSKCLSPDPQRRYPSATELAEDLRREIADLPLRYAARPSTLERLGRWTRRHPRWTTALAVGTAAAILLGVTGTALLSHQSQLRAARIEQAITQFQVEARQSKILLGAPAPSPQQIEQGKALALAALSRNEQLTNSGATGRLDRADVGSLYLLLSRVERIVAGRNGSSLDQARRYNELAGQTWSSPLVGLQRALLVDGNDQVELPTNIDDSRDARAIYLRAVLTMGRSNWSQARQLLEQSLELAPQDASLWASLGHTKMAMQDAAGALAAWRTASALMPDDPYLHHLLGVAHIQLADFASAVASLDRCLKLNPDYAPAYADRGLARFLAGDFPISLARSNSTRPTPARSCSARRPAQS